IHFVVQYLELQNQITEPNTLAAIGALSGRGVIERERAAALQQGFEFLSSVEAAQRLLEETSANSFPKDPSECEVPARYIGFGSGNELVERYLEETGKIRIIFNSVFGID
ncbi:MAG: hypothetical protein EHM61_21025, partial [Acidobacteria bacterium]